ncbi:HEPN domain-containing protein [Chryseobacterium indologenes]|uniref:HEPN domain-containing protein n=1 Tax=Chryseobacterium indologenes TaxID=253 RepID=UPI0023E85839|nr:HEPN domain-containing protein [Chryseobacterium indologenes]WET51424.1 HEPN domain-containing protein [Chryseobacterium indologenes]
MNSKIRVIIPIRGSEEFDILDDNYDLLLKEIIQLGEEKYFIQLLDEKEEQYKKIIDLRIRVILSSKYENNVDEEVEEFSKKYKFFKTEWIGEYLELEFTFLHKLTIFTEIVINHIIKRLSLILHLSYNTKIDFLSGLIFNSSNNKRLIGKTEILMSDIDMAYGHAIKINWPTIKQPTINQTIDWFIHHNFHLDDISQTKIQRAINAFSYSFSNLSEKHTSELFWTMIGIEGLLAEGSSNIISQIKIKTSILLEEPKEFKKKLEKLYNYRSRLVHGDLNFPPKYSNDFDGFEREYWDYSEFALSILIALVKELIIENKTEFKFEYKRIK